MREITVTMEQTRRISDTFRVSNKEYASILENGILPDRIQVSFINSFDFAADKIEDTEYDYSVADDEGRMLKDWD